MLDASGVERSKRIVEVDPVFFAGTMCRIRVESETRSDEVVVRAIPIAMDDANGFLCLLSPRQTAMRLERHGRSCSV